MSTSINSGRLDGNSGMTIDPMILTLWVLCAYVKYRNECVPFDVTDGVTSVSSTMTVYGPPKSELSIVILQNPMVPEEPFTLQLMSFWAAWKLNAEIVELLTMSA